MSTDTGGNLTMNDFISVANFLPVSNTAFVLALLAACIVFTLAGVGHRYRQANMRDVRYTQALINLERGHHHGRW